MESTVLVGSNGVTLWCKRAGDDAEAARLEREVAVLDELDGAGVVELVAANDTQFTSVIAGTRHLGSMAASGQLTRDAAESAVAALDEIHRMGWRHGNLTLDHAVISASGRVRWCSLGAARRIESPSDPAARREREALLLALGDAGIEGLDRPQSARVRGAKSPGAPLRNIQTRPLRAEARRSRDMGTLVGQLVLFVVVGAAACWALSGLTTSTAVGQMATWLGRAVVVAAGYGAIVTIVAAVARWHRHDTVADAAQRWVPRWLRWGAVGSAAISLVGAVMGSSPAPNVAAATPDIPNTEAPSNTTNAATANTAPAPDTAAPSTTSSPATSIATGSAPLPITPPANPPGATGSARAFRPDTRPLPTVVVTRGDHLWGIARTALAAELGRPPTIAEIAPYWRRLIDTNRDRLADPDNPDLIFAGQEFVLPPR